MIAVDTNVVVRLITADNPEQLEHALALLEREQLYVSLTVLLETEWVLRSAFGYGRERICAALRELPLLKNIRIEAEAELAWALGCYETAGELADYIHMIGAKEVGRFATFERRLAQRAGEASPAHVVTLG